MSASVHPESSVSSVDDVMASLARDSVKEMSVDPTDALETTATDLEETPEGDETPEPEKAPTPALPEGMVAVPKIDRQMATQFVIRDAEGEIEPPDLTITFTANGRERQESLDQVVRLAQMGVHNQERFQQAEAAINSRAEIETTLQSIQQTLAAERAAVARMMESDEAYLDAREAYERANSPEARLAAMEAERASEQEKAAFQRDAQIGDAFMDNNVGPALKVIADALPTITEEELAAQIVLAANPLMQYTKFGMILPPSAHAQVSKIVTDELVPWAQELHARRTAAQTKTTTVAQTKLTAAQVEAQRAKNLAAKGMKPVGRAAASASPPRRIARTVDEVNEDVLRDTLASLRG